MEILTDTSPMPFGQFMGDDMEDVPASYLLWLYDNNKCNDAVRLYVKDNYEVLQEQSKTE